VDQTYKVDTSWIHPNVRVTITGVGYFDFRHDQSGVASNAIEIHPVLAIRFGGSSSGGPKPSATLAPPSASGGFSVRAWVTPDPMRYNAYPTLHAWTSPGASCTASVKYSTGRSLASFDGSAQKVGSSGLVGWSWHEETSGSGGEGDVKCTYRGQTKSAVASFTVAG
jgi:hypothetical protein